MSRRRRIEQIEAQQQLARRRRRTAHRSLVARAAQGEPRPQPIGRTAPMPPVKGSRARAIEERVPTSELRAPTWLAADAPAFEPMPTPEEPSADEHPTEVMAPVEDTAVMSPAPERSSFFKPDPADVVEMADVVETPDVPDEPAPADRDASPPADQVFPATEGPWSADAPVTSQPPVAPNTPTTGEYEPQPPKPRRSRAAMAVPIVLLVLIGGYLGAQALVAGSVPRDTETLGIGIGGMARAQATAAVAERAGVIEEELVSITADDAEFGIPGGGAGLTIDATATVDQVTGFTLAPQRLWLHVTGGGELAPVIDVDEGAFAAAMAQAADALDRDAQNAGVTIEGVEAAMVPGRSAITVDTESTGDAVLAAWPHEIAVEAVAHIAPPDVGDDLAAGFATMLTDEAFAAPVELVSPHGDATVEPEELAGYAQVTSETGQLELLIDGEALAAALVADDPELEEAPEDASFVFTDSQQLDVELGAAGRGVDAATLGESVARAAQGADRVVDIPFIEVDPEVGAQELGVDDMVEVVSSFSTPLTAEPVRTQNLRTAAAAIRGVVLQPGDSFDLTDVLSPIDAANGYQNAGVIVNGVLQQGMGGGLSQMATTVFNAAYFAGYELNEHRPHSVWFTRYPAGRESTLFTGSINVVFTNTTPYAAVLNSYVSGGSLHVDVWSTEHFEVETTASPRSNVRQPGVKNITAANCQPKSAGQPGFTITNTRDVYLNDELVDTDRFTWTYQPDDAIRCVSPDDDED